MMNRDKIAMKNVGVLCGMLFVLMGCHRNIVPTDTNGLTKVMATDGDYGDDDQDGVTNIIDQCPKTPMNRVVDRKGCAVPILPIIENITELRLFFNKNENYPIDTQNFEKFGEKIIEAQKEFTKTEKYLTKNEKNLDSFDQHRLQFYQQNYVCVRMDGHSSKGKQGENNDEIAKKRVDIVIQMYQELYGIDKSTFRIEYYGSGRPIASNSTEEGRAMNQRVYMFLHSCTKFKDKK